jgi:chlorobactene glucosyltransferase
MEGILRSKSDTIILCSIVEHEGGYDGVIVFGWIELLGVLLWLYGGFYLWVLYGTIMDWIRMPKLASECLKGPDVLSSDVTLDIVIPARNEESKIDRCLESLVHQTFARFQVWAIDDRSTDNTGKIIRQHTREDDRFHQIEGQDLPQGWAGKVHAIIQALPHLSARWVLFLDADTWLHPECLERALMMAERQKVEMVTLIPVLECKSFWERVILPAVVFLISLKFPLRHVNDPKKPNVAIANGQFILVQRDVYERLGTHRAVQNSMVEDLDLARLAKKSGVKFLMVSGLRYFRVRMYTRFAELREGWTKNLYFGNPDKSPLITVIRVFSIWMLGIYPFLMLLLGLLFPQVTGLTGLSLAVLLLMLVVVVISRWIYKSAPLYALFHPLAMGIIGWFLWESRQRAFSRGVVWKGRYYKANS